MEMHQYNQDDRDRMMRIEAAVCGIEGKGGLLNRMDAIELRCVKIEDAHNSLAVKSAGTAAVTGIVGGAIAAGAASLMKGH